MRAMLLITALGGLVAGVRAQESVVEVARRASEQMEKLGSFQADMESVYQLNVAESEARTVTRMKYTWKRREDQVQWRTESSSTTTGSLEGRHVRLRTQRTTISDGAFVWTIYNEAGEIHHLKAKATPWVAQSVLADFKDYDVRRLPDESVDGRKCWVLDARSKSSGKAAFKRKATWLDQASGFPLKTETYDDQDALVSSQVATNVRINLTIPDERFAFTPPEGVEVLEVER